MDRLYREVLEKGVDVIHLGVGDPDIPTPRHIVQACAKALEDPRHHRYPRGRGLKIFREAVARWFLGRFGVSLNPDTEVLALIGSKEGIAHLPLALTNPSDAFLVPDPGYPVYRTGSILSGAQACSVPLMEENGFLPDLNSISDEVLRRARLLFLNYPNNPTGASAPASFFQSLVQWARSHRIWIGQDAAYSEVYFGEKPSSLLAVPGARDWAVEFHSLSKTFCMTGWRVGWVCGHAEILDRLAQVKDHCDSGVFGAVQEAAAAALNGSQDCVEDMRQTYGSRRKMFLWGLNALGWKVVASESTFYIWAHPPPGYKSEAAAEKMLKEAGVLAAPGNGFGSHGEGYVRFALTVPTNRLEQALDRIAKIQW